MPDGSSRKLPTFKKEVDQPAYPTLPHDFKRDFLDIVLLIPSSSKDVPEDVAPIMRKPHMVHAFSACKGVLCPEVQH